MPHAAGRRRSGLHHCRVAGQLGSKKINRISLIFVTMYPRNIFLEAPTLKNSESGCHPPIHTMSAAVAQASYTCSWIYMHVVISTQCDTGS